jgi:hypothetical protein
MIDHHGPAQSQREARARAVAACARSSPHRAASCLASGRRASDIPPLSPGCVETHALSGTLDRVPSARSAVPRTGNSCCGSAQSTLGFEVIPTTEDNHK